MNYSEADELYAQGRYKEALQVFWTLYAKNPNNSVLNYIGCCYLGMQNYEAARETFEILTTLSPEWERPFFNLGRVYMALECPEKALSQLQKAREVNPEDEDVYYYLGIFYYRNGDLPQAVNFLQHSLYINENQAEAHLDLGTCCFKMRDFDRAAHHFEAAYNLAGNLDALYNTAMAYICLRRYADALGILEKLIKHNPVDPAIQVQISHCRENLAQM